MGRKLIYILGDGRSGSTVVENYLAEHLKGLKIGEARRYWKYRYGQENVSCECSHSLLECAFWRGVELKLPEEHRTLLIHKKVESSSRFFTALRSLLRGRDVVQSALQRSFYNAVFASTECATIIDSSKVPFWAVGLPRSLSNSDVIFIHLVRDLQHCANSWKKKMLLPEYQSKKYMPTRTVWQTVRTWSKINLVSAFAVKGKTVLLDYREFCDSPESLLNKLKAISDFNCVGDVEKHAIGGNPVKAGFNDKVEIKYMQPALNYLTRQEVVLCSIVNYAVRFLIKLAYFRVR